MRLDIGVNAVAHSCNMTTLPSKGDKIGLVVTRIDVYKRQLLLGIVRFIAGYENMTVYVTLNALGGIPLGIAVILQYQFTPDCYEYGPVSYTHLDVYKRQMLPICCWDGPLISWTSPKTVFFRL